MRWTVAGTLIAVACRNAPTPCISGDACGEGRECLANQCVLEGSDPVAPESVRHVVDPSASGIVSAQRPFADAGLPAVATFGNRVTGPATWYLDFAPSWSTTSQIDRAFLVLSPPSSDSPPAADIRLETWRVSEPWRVEDLAWNDQPSREPPRSVGIASSTPPRPTRIDVTSIVRYWQRHPQHRHGMAIEARSGAGHGIGFATGAGGESGPQLEVYVTEEQP